MSWRVVQGSALDVLPTLADGSVQCVVTSPPYFGLRDYGTAGQIGREPTPQAYVTALVAVFAAVWRVLRDDGTLWLNLGDSYATSGGQGVEGSSDGATGRGPRGLRPARTVKPKDLIGIPWRVAFALQEAGWYLRSDIIWAKPNPMPESVTDRPTKAHEYVFLLSKSARYYYDADAIKTRSERAGEICGTGPKSLSRGSAKGQNVTASGNAVPGGFVISPDYSNCRSVWELATQPYPEAHFATFPEELSARCIKAGTKLGDLILDPFCGAGTTGLVADRLARDFIGIELNPAYCEMARRRIRELCPLFTEECDANLSIDL